MGVDLATAWNALSDLASHSEWMKDAISIEFTSESRRGVGTVLRVPTRIWFLRTEDTIEVVGWEEGRCIEIIHTGAVKGRGTLSLEEASMGTTVRWEEELQLPWWFGGRLGEWVAKPVISSMWRGNLARFEASLRSP